MKPCVVAIALLLVACAHDLALMKRDEVLHAYAATVRWNSLDAARRYQSARATQHSSADRLRGVKVSGYHVLDQALDREHLTLIQTVELRYYRSGDLVDKTLTFEENWRYDDDLATWVIDTPLPDLP